MNIAVQASDLDHERIDGTRVYLLELLRRFGTLAPEIDFSVYHRGTFNPLLVPPVFTHYHVKEMSFPWAWMQTRFAFALFCTRPEKLFLPIQAAPVFLPRSLEVTATIHDLAFRRYPETFPRADLWKLNFMLETVVKRADKLIAVSASTKRDLLVFFPHLPESRVRVIHHGFDGAFFGSRLSDVLLADILATYHLQRATYILYVGALQPRKNLIRLIRAFEQVKKNVSDMKLVLAGEPAWLSEGILEACKYSQFRNDIIVTGRVSFETLRALYQGARLFVFPSLYEGFGLPILEAFASGIPVLTADNSSLREVAGDGAFYCQATDILDITLKLECLWNDEQLRQELISKGAERLQYFSWEKCARETLEYMRE